MTSSSIPVCRYCVWYLHIQAVQSFLFWGRRRLWCRMGLILPFIQAGFFRVQPTKKKPGKGKRQQSSFSSPMHERKRRGNSQDGQKGTISENFSPGEEERGEEEKRGDAAQREEGEGWKRDGNSIFERKQWMIFKPAANGREKGEKSWRESSIRLWL